MLLQRARVRSANTSLKKISNIIIREESESGPYILIVLALKNALHIAGRAAFTKSLMLRKNGKASPPYRAPECHKSFA